MAPISKMNRTFRHDNCREREAYISDLESCLREIVECDKESDFGINDECIFFRDEESWSKSERLKAALDKARELVNAQSARSQT